MQSPQNFACDWHCNLQCNWKAIFIKKILEQSLFSKTKTWFVTLKSNASRFSNECYRQLTATAEGATDYP